MTFNVLCKDVARLKLRGGKLLPSFLLFLPLPSIPVPLTNYGVWGSAVSSTSGVWDE